MFSSLFLSAFASLAEARNFTFDESNVALNGSLYQSTYLDGSIFATSSVGRVVNDSFLFKVNADSLEVIETNKLPRDNKTHTVWPVYGIDADPRTNQIWVTNTRDNSVSVYDDNAALVSHLPVNTTIGSRDVIVDEQSARVYASSSRSGNIGIYDANTREFLSTINLATDQQPFQGVMELVIDEANQVLYTVSLSSNVAAGIDLKNDNKVTYYQLGNATRASAVAYDGTRNHLFVASQGSDEILVIDTQSNSAPSSKSIQLPSSLSKRAAHDDVSAEIHVADGGLYAGYEPKNDLLYVVNRVEAEVYVIDAGSLEILTTLKTGKFPNHVSFDPSGNVFVVDKDTPSRLHRYAPHAVGNSTSSGNSTASASPSGHGGSAPASASGKGGNGNGAAPSGKGGNGNGAAPSGKGGNGNGAAPSGKGGNGPAPSGTAAAAGSGSGGRGGAAASGSAASGKGGAAPGVHNGASPVLMGAGVAVLPALALLI